MDVPVPVWYFSAQLVAGGLEVGGSCTVAELEDTGKPLSLLSEGSFSTRNKVEL